MITSALAAILLSACSSPRIPRSSDYDDVYYSSSDGPSNSGGSTPAADYTSANQDNQNSDNTDNSNDPRFDYGNQDNQGSSQSQSASDPSYSSNTSTSGGNTYITNNYYDDDDYYDYAYSSRIRRFHTSVGCGYGYYNDYYTNSYWYDYNPWSYGVSIYLS